MTNNHPNKVPAPLSRDALLLSSHIPSYVRSILLVGARRGEIGYLLRKRLNTQVHGVEPHPDLANIAQHCLDSVAQVEPNEAKLQFDNNHFDAFISLSDDDALTQAASAFKNLGQHLKKNGHIFFLVQESDPSNTRDRIEEFANQSDLVIHHQWTEETKQEHTHSDRRPSLLMLTPRNYNPHQHAIECDAANDPKGAFEILCLIPQPQETDQAPAVQWPIEKQEYLLHWFQIAQDPENLDIFCRALELFNSTAAHRPIIHATYQYQAQFWHLIGNNRMAQNLLHSVHAVAPNDEVTQQLETLEDSNPKPAINDQLPNKSVASQDTPNNDTDPKRILFIMHPRIHYGIDVLYDGLCSILGDENVVDYPYKPTLHGQQADQLRNYPCTLDRAGTNFSLERVLDELAAGYFDCILFGDCEGDLDKDTVQQLARAADIPLFIVDSLDECYNIRSQIEDRLERKADAYFKREMLRGVDYGAETFPLSFAFLDHRIPQNLQHPRTTGLFWAGHRSSGLRKLFLDHLEEKCALRFDSAIPPEDYAQRLLSARIGLSCFGFGFDTVRYWELPAYGCMLLSEEPPIHIPHNFTHEENAVFFQDLTDLEEKVQHYLKNPQEADHIAKAGYHHLKQHHTASARARQLLNHIAAL